MEFDERVAAAVEAAYTTPDVVAQRARLVELLALQPGERVLDIGFGPGFLAGEIAEAVGTGGAVHGVDTSEAMLAVAQRRTRSANAAPVTWAIADALALGVPDDSFDAAVCTQVYEYVPDMPAALAEARRVLRPGGRLLIMDTDMASMLWRTEDPDRMARVLRAWNEHLVHPDLPRRLPQLLREAGLTLEHCEVIPLLTVGPYQGTFSESLITFIEAFVGEDAAEWAAELRGQGEDYFFSANRYVFLARA